MLLESPEVRTRELNPSRLMAKANCLAVIIKLEVKVSGVPNILSNVRDRGVSEVTSSHALRLLIAVVLPVARDVGREFDGTDAIPAPNDVRVVATTI